MHKLIYVFLKIVERVGVVGRNDIGMLLWEKNEELTEKWNLGSRLKTPALPMWVTMVNGNYGVLFNPNRELMRSYHAENRFQLYYYADAEFKKEERKDTLLTIDTRTKQGPREVVDDNDDLGMISNKNSQITIFGHKHKIKNFIKKGPVRFTFRSSISRVGLQ